MLLVHWSHSLAGVAILAWLALTGPAWAGVLNGDFSLGTNNWRFVFAPGNVQIPGYGVAPMDIDGGGPLSNSPAFYASVGDDALMNLEQDISLNAGGLYVFSANIAMTPYSYNADGGTIAVYIGGTLVTSYSFGFTTIGVNKYATLAAPFSPATTGVQTLSIHFSRGYGYGAGNTPTDYIYNISVAPPPISLSIQTIDNAAVLSWTNAAYVLQAAPSANGTYTNVAAASSPFTNSTSASATFFRLVAN